MPSSPDKNHPLNFKKDGNVLRTRKIKNIPLYDEKEEMVNTFLLLSHLLLILKPVLVSASPVRKVDATQEVKNFDTNNDKKIDYVIINERKIVKEIKEDINFDGIFDRQTLFFSEDEEFTKIVDQKKIGNKPRKKISYWIDTKLKKYMSLTQIDKNDDSKWDIEYRSHSDLLEFRNKCNQDDGLGKTQNFTEEIIHLVNGIDEYTLTDSGFRVEKSCFMENSKEWFLKNLENSIQEGLGCLEKLKNEKDGNGALKNFSLLKNILAPPPSVQILCNESSDEYNWSKAVAHGTAGPVASTSRLQHPGISIDPEYLKEKKTQGERGEKDLKKTLFHELFHNIGYKHFHDVEYAYACESCCIPSEDDTDEVRSVSCKICKKSYTDASDLEYIKDISDFSHLVSKKDIALKTSIKYLKENPGNLDGLSFLAMNLSDVFSPVGIELSKLITSEKENLTEDQKNRLLTAREYEDQIFLKPFEETSKIIATAYYYTYANQDPKTGLELILKEEKKIKEALKSQHLNQYDKFIKRHLHENLMNIINEVFVNHYYGKDKVTTDKENELSDLSYKLYLTYKNKS